MFKSVLVAVLAAIVACTTYIEHEAPVQKIHYGGGRHYNDWHDKVYIYCGQQPDPWKCAIHHGIAI